MEASQDFRPLDQLLATTAATASESRMIKEMGALHLGSPETCCMRNRTCRACLSEQQSFAFVSTYRSLIYVRDGAAISAIFKEHDASLEDVPLSRPDRSPGCVQAAHVPESGHYPRSPPRAKPHAVSTACGRTGIDEKRHRSPVT